MSLTGSVNYAGERARLDDLAIRTTKFTLRRLHKSMKLKHANGIVDAQVKLAGTKCFGKSVANNHAVT